MVSGEGTTCFVILFVAVTGLDLLSPRCPCDPASTEVEQGGDIQVKASIDTEQRESLAIWALGCDHVYIGDAADLLERPVATRDAVSSRVREMGTSKSPLMLV